MTRWIVNPETYEVRAVGGSVTEMRTATLAAGEFFFDAPVASDAAMAGRRHNLAVEALESLPDAAWAEQYTVVADRVEWNAGTDTGSALSAIAELQDSLDALGFEVWREGRALLVLICRNRAADLDGGSAWVSELR